VTTIEIAAQSGGWVSAPRGSTIEVIDVEGQQVADVFAVSAADRSEHLSVRWTRAATGRLFPQVGQFFYSNRAERMLSFVEDRSPGPHDMLHASCDPLLYQLLGAGAAHPNCADNFRLAAGQVGWDPPDVPDPVNLFQNTPVLPSGAIDVRGAVSAPGDSVVLHAEMDLLLVVTACSVDLDPFINGSTCTGIRVVVHLPEAS
jgi:uncharacterized protein YcgI (DUF1989 family)